MENPHPSDNLHRAIFPLYYNNCLAANQIRVVFKTRTGDFNKKI